MTPEQKLALTVHLAEEVMGRESKMFPGCITGSEYKFHIRKPNGIDWERFNPLEDANQTLKVMEKLGAWASIKTVLGSYCVAVNGSSHTGESFLEAACLACAKATGYQGEQE